MNLGLISLIALLSAIVIGFVRKANVGILCIGFSMILGLVYGIKAGDIIKAIAPIVGGKGGGKPDSAMGGGTNLLKVDDALAAVDDFVAEKVQ